MVLGAEQQPAQPTPPPMPYDAKNRRDPFVALVQGGRITGASQRPATGTTKPVLYGILWDAGGQSIALINDQEAKVGDTVNGYRVKEIRQDAVVLEGEGGPIELRISFFDAPSKGGAKP